MNVNFVAIALCASLVSFVPAHAEDVGTGGDLRQAIEQSNREDLKRRLAAGADVNAIDKSGTSPLMYAAMYSDAEGMRLFLNRGAAVNVRNNAGATALMWSAGNIEKVRLLIEHGADVNAQAISGRTPLIIAASNPGNVDTVKLLLSKGAQLKLMAATGGAVFAAANAGDELILKVLLKAGGDPNERDNAGRTALIVACQFGRVEPAEVLLNAGAKVNEQSGRRPLAKVGLQELGEQTALLIAAATGNPTLVKFLLDRGADINAKDMRGMTPLMMAASSETQNAETIRILLARGADPNWKANDGQSAISWAEKWGDSGVLKNLQRRSVATNHRTAATVAEVPQEPNARTAIETSLALLQASSTRYFEKSGCVGCHHQPLTAMAVSLARERGLNFNEEVAKEQLRTMVTVRLPERESLLQGVARGGAPMRDSLMLMGIAAEKYPGDALTVAFTHALAGMQSQDGAWHSHIVRQPIEHSAFSETAYAIRALQLYGPSGRKPEFAKRIARARSWLLSHTPKDNEDRVKQLLGLAWSGTDPEPLRKTAAQLISEQQPDGGWAQRPGFASDAYATGQTLYALSVGAALRSSDPAYQRGVEYLRRTQFKDGSWLVRSRSLKFQPYFDSGFPHEHDQWISAAATAWATMALTLGLESPAVASR